MADDFVCGCIVCGGDSILLPGFDSYGATAQILHYFGEYMHQRGVAGKEECAAIDMIGPRTMVYKAPIPRGVILLAMTNTFRMFTAQRFARQLNDILAKHAYSIPTCVQELVSCVSDPVEAQAEQNLVTADITVLSFKTDLNCDDASVQFDNDTVPTFEFDSFLPTKENLLLAGLLHQKIPASNLTTNTNPTLSRPPSLSRNTSPRGTTSLPSEPMLPVTTTPFSQPLPQTPTSIAGTGIVEDSNNTTQTLQVAVTVSEDISMSDGETQAFELMGIVQVAVRSVSSTNTPDVTAPVSVNVCIEDRNQYVGAVLLNPQLSATEENAANGTKIIRCPIVPTPRGESLALMKYRVNPGFRPLMVRCKSIVQWNDKQARVVVEIISNPTIKLALQNLMCKVSLAPLIRFTLVDVRTRPEVVRDQQAPTIDWAVPNIESGAKIRLEALVTMQDSPTDETLRPSKLPVLLHATCLGTLVTSSKVYAVRVMDMLGQPVQFESTNPVRTRLILKFS